MNITRLITGVLLAVVVAVGYSCGKDDQGPTGTAPGPTLEYAPQVLTFDDPNDAGPKMLEVWNGGTGTLSWRASESAHWMTLSPDSGTSGGDRDTIVVATDMGGLPYDTATQSKIILTTSSSVDTVSVTGTRQSPPPRLSVAPLLIDLAYLESSEFYVRNAGVGALDWAAGANKAWLTLSKPSGSLAASLRDTVGVTVDWVQIPLGVPQIATVRVTSPADTAEVRVQVLRAFSPAPCVDREGFAFSEISNPGPASFRVRNCGDGGTLSWTAKSNKNWLRLSPASGTSDGEWQTVSVSVLWGAVPREPSPLAEIDVNGIVIPVVAHHDPLLSVDRDGFVFREGTDPGSQLMRIRNNGTSALDWTATADQPWVTLSATSGTSLGEWDDVMVGVDWDNAFPTSATITIQAGVDSKVLPLTALSNCRFRFASPTAASSWTAGDRRLIDWQEAGVQPYDRRLALYKGDVLIQDLTHDLIYGATLVKRNWLVTTRGQPSGSDYRFRLSGSCFYHPCTGSCSQWSDDFTITVPFCHIVVDPGVTFFTHPDFYWYIGSAHEIKWATSEAAAQVAIDLYFDGVLVGNITPGTANDGSFDWVVDDFGLGEGDLYQIRVTDASDPACVGFSDFVFLRIVP